MNHVCLQHESKTELHDEEIFDQNNINILNFERIKLRLAFNFERIKHVNTLQ